MIGFTRKCKKSQFRIVSLEIGNKYQLGFVSLESVKNLNNMIAFTRKWQ